MDLRHLRALALASAVGAALLVSGCSSADQGTSTSAGGASLAPVSSAPADSGGPEAVAVTIAACGEITRITREEMEGLVDDDATDWERFAVSLQSIADGSADAEFGAATTQMATAALRTAESLRAGKPLGPALTDFEDAIPAVDSVCKRVGAPLN